MLAAVWGTLWQGRVVCFCCDNAALVNMIHLKRNTESLVMQLLRGFHLFAVEHTFQFSALHIAGKESGPADALSCNQNALFHSQVAQAPAIPEPLQLFVVAHPTDWLLGSWKQQLTTILGKALQSPQITPTIPASSNTSSSANTPMC